MKGDSLTATLAGIVGPANVLVGAADLAPCLTDWRGRYRGAARCLVRPASTAEVAAVVGACAAAGAPIVPQGGNTGLCGAATPDDTGSAVVVSLGRLNRIVAVDASNDTISVEAGCTLAAVQEAARAADRLFDLPRQFFDFAQILAKYLDPDWRANAGRQHVDARFDRHGP